ncbi:acyl carrier protein [Mycobacterium sp. C31M]
MGFQLTTEETVVRQQIREVLTVQGRLSVDPGLIADDANLYEIGLTSHASVNVMLALEDRFDIEFPDEALTKATFTSIESIERVVADLADIGA